ncbi:hypothetical protein [Neomoorella thermoacetica]|uniref:hypothetical protein n=1 Tax=Neomoorella thermoacetica TaxID=1525 RepID=UPI0008FADC3E|nr:hypothetical protein [Moorella thermoacetica]OIQ52788.1 hypothetical protein MORE_25680 [Moorella thermoacetica]
MRTRIILIGAAVLILGGGLLLYFLFGYPFVYPGGRGTAPAPFFGLSPGETSWQAPDNSTGAPAGSPPGNPGEGAGVSPAPGGSAPEGGSLQQLTRPGLSEPENQVWQEYAPRLRALQGQYQSRLDALLARAYADYQRNKNDRAKLLSLAAYYLKAGSALEGEADGAFNSIAGAMEAELRARHLPLTMVQDLRRQYRDLKQQRRRAIFSRAWALINS